MTPSAKPVWKMKLRISGPTCAVIYRDDALGLQKEVRYKRRFDPMGRFKCGKHQYSFFIDQDPCEYPTEEEMLNAHRASSCLNGSIR